MQPLEKVRKTPTCTRGAGIAAGRLGLCFQSMRKKEQRMFSEALVNRVRGEFIEMPGLQLTMPEAARLWGMDIVACERVIEALVDASFLRWTPAGKVTRAQRL
jgi:hypothetical protein